MTTHTGTTRTKSPRVAWNRHAASLVPYRSQDATVSVLALVCQDQPDCQSQQLQPLEAWALLAENDGSSSWEHWSHLLRPTASAAGTIGLNLRGQQLQQLEPLVSVSETDGCRS
ncbi:hypothetical protein PCASD_01684 [Puccinia coronata f. sp. avenae]|uniref:Uncharacterized protein n=1 Tax=Puccinia coronata f. sp. avenae TaxID=200324 RepID=A0A2N5VJY4_9BASI|nr:hypothetical protein PCASD_01684 [Puccinia coronata f. sp. avenae]